MSRGRSRAQSRDFASARWLVRWYCEGCASVVAVVLDSMPDTLVFGSRPPLDPDEPMHWLDGKQPWAGEYDGVQVDWEGERQENTVVTQYLSPLAELPDPIMLWCRNDREIVLRPDDVRTLVRRSLGPRRRRVTATVAPRAAAQR